MQTIAINAWRGKVFEKSLNTRNVMQKVRIFFHSHTRSPISCSQIHTYISTYAFGVINKMFKHTFWSHCVDLTLNVRSTHTHPLLSSTPLFPLFVGPFYPLLRWRPFYVMQQTTMTTAATTTTWCFNLQLLSIVVADCNCFYQTLKYFGKKGIEWGMPNTLKYWKLMLGNIFQIVFWKKIFIPGTHKIQVLNILM